SIVTNPLFSDTLTDCTRSIFLTATLTAWAQISQSIPSVLSSMCRSSAFAVCAVNSVSASVAVEIRLRMFVLHSVQPEKIARVDGGTKPFVRHVRGHIAVGGKLHAARQPVASIEQQQCGTDE